jgi:adenosylcobyric acid synthase
VTRTSDDDWLNVGIRRGAVFGTHWHGLLDNDEVRRQWLIDAAAAAGRHGFVVADDVDVTARRDAQLDVMADLLAAHLDVAAVLDLLERGVPPRPVITSAISAT